MHSEITAPRSRRGRRTRLAALPTASANRTTKTLTKNAWCFSQSGRDSPPPNCAPSSTKYNPNWSAVLCPPKAITIGALPKVRTKSATPAPGQYDFTIPAISRGPWISKVPKVHSFCGTSSPEPPMDFAGAPLKVPKGGSFSSTDRFKGASSSTPGPGEYTRMSLPTSNSSGTTFPKAPRTQTDRLARSMLSIGPGLYECPGTFCCNSGLSFLGAVELKKHIPLSDEDIKGISNDKLTQDLRFVERTAQEIKRWQMMSLFKAA